MSEIEDFIQKALERGENVSEIKKHLSSKGWPENAIKKALANHNNKGRSELPIIQVENDCRKNK